SLSLSLSLPLPPSLSLSLSLSLPPFLSPPSLSLPPSLTFSLPPSFLPCLFESLRHTSATSWMAEWRASSAAAPPTLPSLELWRERVARSTPRASLALAARAKPRPLQASTRAVMFGLVCLSGWLLTAGVTA
ncbi:hypothetical protein AMELA_G00004150, partial [Ameiurus melas]